VVTCGDHDRRPPKRRFLPKGDPKSTVYTSPERIADAPISGGDQSRFKQSLICGALVLELCGEIADGVIVHPLHWRRYLDEIVRPNVALVHVL
jgi:hypothetical protein